MKLIYLASPYSHKSYFIRWKRWKDICKLQAHLTKNNEDCCFYGPITMNHLLTIFCSLPVDYAYWQASCETVLSRCNELWVCKLRGWDTSRGVTEEVKLAVKLGIPIKYVEGL